MRSRSPGRQSPGSPLKVVEARLTVPRTSSMVMVNSSPLLSMTFWSSTKRPSRILGPWRSTRMATARPEAAAASRMRPMTSSWSSARPWERLMRATFMPASTSACTCSGESVAGPRVHTILALRMGSEYGTSGPVHEEESRQLSGCDHPHPVAVRRHGEQLLDSFFTNPSDLGGPTP